MANKNTDWLKGDPDDRPTMSLKDPGSTDWMATASLDDPKDLTDDEYRELRQAQRNRRKETAIRSEKTLDEIKNMLDEFDGEYPETRAEAVADSDE